MDKTEQVYSCVNCEKSEAEAPILRVRFMGSEAAICTSCLPVLIHKPQRLVGRLEGAERIQPSGHAHD